MTIKGANGEFPGMNRGIGPARSSPALVTGAWR